MQELSPGDRKRPPKTKGSFVLYIFLKGRTSFIPVFITMLPYIYVVSVYRLLENVANICLYTLLAGYF